MDKQDKAAQKRTAPKKDVEEKGPKDRPKDLKAKEREADDVKGGRYSAWSDRRLKSGIRSL